ncbi:T-complex protein 1 subunit eta, partial [Zancudomyces culisetae]
CLATGARILSTVSSSSSSSSSTSFGLGSCDLFEEVQLGNSRFNVFTGCPVPAAACTLVLRGGSLQFIDEVHRSLTDALNVVKRLLSSPSFVAGGGAVELDLSRHLKAYSRSIPGKRQLVVAKLAKALELVPRLLCENAGLDPIDLLTQLRALHAKDPTAHLWYGLNLTTGRPDDMLSSFVYEPSLIKANALCSAIEATKLILSIDLSVNPPPPPKNPQ